MYRTLPGSWLRNLPYYLPLMFVVNFSIYRLITTPGQPLLGALVIWSFAIILTRTFVSVVLLKDHISPGLWIAIGFMIAARIAQQTWR